MKFNKVFDYLPVAVIVLKFNCNLHYLNEKAENLLTSIFGLDIENNVKLNKFFKKNFESIIEKIMENKFAEEEYILINERFSLKVNANLIDGEELALIYPTIVER